MSIISNDTYSKNRQSERKKSFMSIISNDTNKDRKKSIINLNFNLHSPTLSKHSNNFTEPRSS